MNIFGEKTLVDNWFEDRVLEEDKIKEYLEKRERGELLSQKNASLSTAMLNATQLATSADGWVKFGDQVVFQNPHLFNDEHHLALTFAGETATALEYKSPQVSKKANLPPPTCNFYKRSFCSRRILKQINMRTS